ncbi:hypothetical protein FVQ98_13415 [Ottowia sp. GY511]|uniref:BssS family protein n=1 Tax=Ottowia flava TaxID=2675430 RepID=A0ABW4KXY8_9BURK|nr:hypothetical protein [Ottowia sp. GY511]TXK26625.1 hypothetical protein FVQ98_13415 [Ottowia sp. GY511]
MENQNPVLPVVRWGISQAPSHQIGLLRIEYLTAAGDIAGAPAQSPIFGFSPQQLRALGQSLQQVADQLEAAAPDVLSKKR